MASRLARCDELSPPYGLTGLPAARAGSGTSSATTTTATTIHQHLRALQRDFAHDPVSWAAHTYLSMETMSIAG